jgi:hypothetical protein
VTFAVCPFCAGPVMWCGDQPGEEHACHEILCTVCKANFDMARTADPGSVIERLDDLKRACCIAFNRRTNTSSGATP